ncbi:hypothetical protein [Photobacterium sanguinicancri]|nr:hypothetical protein [Photobacterium sanguinicancri]
MDELVGELVGECLLVTAINGVFLSRMGEGPSFLPFLGRCFY